MLRRNSRATAQQQRRCCEVAREREERAKVRHDATAQQLCNSGTHVARCRTAAVQQQRALAGSERACWERGEVWEV
eukprot:349679-Chlamydomonas_euryale.AAC.18